jgi:antitoxin MazE
MPITPRSKIPHVRSSKKSTSIRRNSTVSRWGNSLGVRIPREAAEQLKLRAGERVRVEVKSGAMTITPMRKKWSESEMLHGVRPEMVESEIDWGPAMGKELW